MDVAATLVGLVVVATTASSVFVTLLVPRAQQSSTARVSATLVQTAVRAAARRARTFHRVDRILSTTGPLILLTQVAVWSVAFGAGFSLLLVPYVPDLPAAIREAASSMLTLGFATTPDPVPTAIDIAAAVSGFGLITLQIAYLPTIYDAFNRRETLVTMLEARAGSPPWGPEILYRHRLSGLEDDLPDLFREWERWAADLAESHTNYPVLLTLRSPHVRRFWLLSLIAVMDAAAMYLALFPSRPGAGARLCIRMGFTALRDIATASNIDFDPDPRPTDPITLTYAEFEAGVAHATSTGLVPEVSTQQAWGDFRGWRVNWESVAHQLAYDLGAPPTLWAGPRWFRHEVLFPSRPRNRRPDDPDAQEQLSPDYRTALPDARADASDVADPVDQQGGQA